MRSDLKQLVTVELTQIERLLSVFADLLTRMTERPPTLEEIAATGSVLHSYYNGLEAVFGHIARGLDGAVPESRHWHQDLLIQMTLDMPDRRAVISPDTYARLARYLAFRHFFRHSYPHLVSGSRMANLVMTLSDTWSQAKHELTAFVASLPASSG